MKDQVSIGEKRETSDSVEGIIKSVKKQRTKQNIKYFEFEEYFTPSPSASSAPCGELKKFAN